jgi:vancomycin resistance protein YoaR
MNKKKPQKSPDLAPTESVKEKNKKFVIKKWHKILVAIFLLLILVPVGTVFAFEQIFSNKIYPGIKIGDLSLGGKNKIEAASTLKEATRRFNEEGISFVYQDKTASLVPIVTATNDPDLSRTIFILENEKTIEEAFSLGRNENFWNNLKNQLGFLIFGQKIKIKYQTNIPEMKSVLEETFGYFEKPTQNAKLKIISTRPEVVVDVTPEQDGIVFDYDAAIESAFLKVSTLDKTPNVLNLISEKPQIKKDETVFLAARAARLAKLCSLTFGEAKKTWTISENQILEWLEFQSTPAGLAVGLSEVGLEEYLKNLTSIINTEPQNAKLTIENGKVEDFQVHQGGKELNVEASYDKINDFIVNLSDERIANSCPNSSGLETINLIVKITAPQIPIGSVNNLGIQELIGEGVSNFAGSPTNRRHNIKVGATKLNGVLIAPGEEFSLVKTLGDIDGSTGYLPELVIKGDKTIPEYGGGLCQIGTTAFRVALDAGLPITERRSHSYRVVYYEPAGTDATIYSPRPDLKFINDTPAYLLLQTKIEGDELTFELWGTPDGRKVEMTTPRVFNFVSPGPTKMIETEDLEPGVKKCTERAHTGADAEFSRTITDKNGEVKTETWTSHYVPWSAVCLVGKEPTPPPAEPPPAEPTLPSGITDPALNPSTF